jgi:FlgN protein
MGQYFPPFGLDHAFSRHYKQRGVLRIFSCWHGTCILPRVTHKALEGSMYENTDPNPDHWQQLHDELKQGLEHEIRLTRELLSNMRQEEISLMLHDASTLAQVLQVRAEMLEKLSLLRLHRLKTTEKLEKIALLKHPHRSSVEEILPLHEESSSEILSLSDQLITLTEKIHRQNTQNQRLSAYGDSPLHPAHQLPLQSKPKKKVAVVTYNIHK